MFLYYIHRYIRLTPAFLLILFISIHLIPYFGHGSMYPIRKVHPDEACLPISWYLYNDMQFHWIAPFILIPFVIERKFVASIIAAIFVFISISSILGTLIYYPTISFGPLQGIATENDGPSFFKSVYVAPWCRISAYAIDLMVGFLVIKASRTYRFKLSTKIIGNLVMCLIALTCIFSMYADAILVPGLNRSWLVAYQTLSHTCWSLVIGWLIFLCSTNQGGIINTILSWSIWTPLARLTYGTYLIHTTVINVIVFNRTVPFYFQSSTVINDFMAQCF
ncbi:unnamed protein product [Rotaria sp. Silwood2]|nr:unnamed protein product [Rotaria sp. Silwood2]